MIVDNISSYSETVDGGDTADQVIEISILKIRRMQITGNRNECHRLLIIETLNKAIKEKLSLTRVDSNCMEIDISTAYSDILADAISRLGLSRLVRISLEVNDDDPDSFPKIRLPNGSRKQLRNHEISSVIDQ